MQIERKKVTVSRGRKGRKKAFAPSSMARLLSNPTEILMFMLVSLVTAIQRKEFQFEKTRFIFILTC